MPLLMDLLTKEETVMLSQQSDLFGFDIEVLKVKDIAKIATALMYTEYRERKTPCVFITAEALNILYTRWSDIKNQKSDIKHPTSS